MSVTYDTVTVAPVLVADTFMRRLVGLRPWPLASAALFAGASVHGRGMIEPVTVVGLDPAGTVVGVRRLDPGRIVTFRGASMMLELPPALEAPVVGVHLTLGPVDLDGNAR